jgi:hypothetical protein
MIELGLQKRSKIYRQVVNLSSDRVLQSVRVISVRIQIACAAHLTSDTNYIEGSIPGISPPGREANHSSPFNALG